MKILNKLKGNSLVKSSLIYTVARFLILGINFITFPIFSRILSPTDYGITATFTTWLGFVSVICGLQMNSCIPIAKSKFSKDEYEELLTTILSFSIITFIFLIGFAFTFNNNLIHFTGMSFNLIMLLLIQSLFAFIANVYNTVIIQEKQEKKYLLISVSFTVLNVILSVFLVVIMKNNKYLGKIIGAFICNLVFGIIMYAKISKFKININKDLLIFALKISIPIVPHIVGHQILSASDRIVLSNITGLEAVGLYSYAYNIGGIVNIIWGAINTAWVPWYFEKMRYNKVYEIKKYIKNYITIFTAITIILIFTTPEVGKILAPKSYWEGIKIVPIIAFSYFFSFLYSFPVNIQFYKEKTNYIPIGTALAAIVNVVLNLIFIPKYGILAATLSTLISYILLFIFHLLIVKYLLKYKDTNTKYYLISSIVVFIFIIVFYLTMNNLIYRYSILVAIAIFVYIKRNDFIKLLKRK